MGVFRITNSGRDIVLRMTFRIVRWLLYVAVGFYSSDTTRSKHYSHRDEWGYSDGHLA